LREKSATSVLKLLELPVLIGAVGEIPPDDEGDASLLELDLGKLVGLSNLGGSADHEGCVFGDLEGASAQDAGLLILGHEARGDALVVGDAFLRGGLALGCEAIFTGTCTVFLAFNLLNDVL